MKLLPTKDQISDFRFFVLIFVLLFLWWHSRDKVRAGQIELTSNGQTVAVLKTDSDGEPVFQLTAKDGRRVQITPGGISGWSKDNKITFNLLNGSPSGSSATYGPSLTLFDRAGENRAAMYLADDTPFLVFNSYQALAKGQGRKYAAHLVMHGTSESASMEIYDKDGKITWNTP